MSFSSQLPSDKQFYVQNGPALSSGPEFLSALESGEITDESFAYHLERKDFSKWVAECLEETDLAKALNKVKTKKSYVKKLKEA